MVAAAPCHTPGKRVRTGRFESSRQDSLVNPSRSKYAMVGTRSSSMPLLRHRRWRNIWMACQMSNTSPPAALALGFAKPVSGCSLGGPQASSLARSRVDSPYGLC